MAATDPIVEHLSSKFADHGPRINGTTTLASELETSARSIDLLLDLNQRRLVTGSAILDAPESVQSLWGDGHQSIWARGEPLLICGGDGVGKTTIAGQLALARAGIKPPSLLGFPVASEGHRVLYLACDRPAQAVRSFRRMVSEDERQLLEERLVIWRGPLPFDLACEPDALLALAGRTGCDVVILDSLKDVAADLSKEETGQGLNRAFQNCCADGVEVCGLHHQRKAQANAGKPKHLADVYGSRWLTAGCGSVVMLWGEAGDPVVEFTHLKQPDEPVGPFQIVHDHLRGSSTVLQRVDAYTIVMGSPNGITAAEIAQTLFGNSDHNAVRKARRQLDRLLADKTIHCEPGTRGGASGSDPARYYPVSLLRQGAGDRDA